jgi:hypothetical protein
MIAEFRLGPFEQDIDDKPALVETIVLHVGADESADE